jgi:hypothetical protein
LPRGASGEPRFQRPAALAALGGVAGLSAAAGCGESARQAQAPAPRGDARFLLGRWSAELRQRGLEPLPVTADIRALDPRARNTVSDTGIDCSGPSTYLGARGPDYRFREAIDRGRGGKCKGVGEVSLIHQGADRLHYTFRGGGVDSHGVIAHER